METTNTPLTGIEKLRRLVAVKEEAERDARWRYKNDPEYRAIFDELEKNLRESQIKSDASTSDTV